MTPRLQTHFLPHGAGPWPWMPERGPTHASLAAYLGGFAASLPIAPKAVLMVSAHWEEPQPTLMTAARPGMYYDYYNFPPHCYEVVYPAPGDPALADHVQSLLRSAGWRTATDGQRGFDHGAFVPLSIVWPQADMPVVQLSMIEGLDPAEHMALGRALAPLRDEGVLIVGSGFSFHNGMIRDPAMRAAVSRAFDGWLQAAVVERTGEARSAELARWSAAPGARGAHPREEHLLPLMVAVGAAEHEPAVCSFHDPAVGGTTTISGFAIGATAA